MYAIDQIVIGAIQLMVSRVSNGMKRNLVCLLHKSLY